MAFLFELLLILVIVFFIRLFFITPYQILGPAMDASVDGGQQIGNTYVDGEFILVDKFSFVDFGFWSMSDPGRGDVVVFTPRVSPVKKYLIKRVIGTPGDMVKIQDGYVWIRRPGDEDYTQLDESAYLMEKNLGNTCVRYAATR